MQKRFLTTALIAMLFGVFSSHATWYEVTGQAVIEQGDLASARQQAINDALKRAALFSGASFSASQQLVNGIIKNEQYQLDSHSEIQQVQLLSETQHQNLLTITLRADILPQNTQCQSNSYKKSMLFSQIRLIPRQDAIYGNLFRLDQDTAAQLEKQLRDYSPVVQLTPLTDYISLPQLQPAVAELLFSKGSQYLLTAAITDLSLGNKLNTFWQDASKERFFALDVVLYDLFEQHVVLQQEYRTSAPWPYKEKSTPQSHSQAFWNMPYGNKINTVLLAVAEDVQLHLKCQPLLGQINQVQQNSLTLNLGSSRGLKTGDLLNIIQIQRHPTQPHIRQLLESPIQVKIESLSQHSARAVPVKQQLLSHIQAGDLISIAR